jgi:phospholipase/carboxylesterase
MIDGPRIAPRSGTAKQLVVFLHGYGANGDDLISLGREWQPLLPDAAFVSPNAPEPVPGYPMGRQWFGLTFRDPDERWRGVMKARPVLDEFLDAELAKHNLPASALALVGFSQGTMMALHAGLRRPALAGIVGYSGVLVTPSNEAAAAKASEEITTRPPVLLVHGDQDEMIPAQALFLSAQGLGAMEVPTEWHLSQGVGHGIDADGLRLGGAFLQKAFRGR